MRYYSYCNTSCLCKVTNKIFTFHTKNVREKIKNFVIKIHPEDRGNHALKVLSSFILFHLNRLSRYENAKALDKAMQGL